MKKNETGSAHLVIIAILSLIIVGLLGFTFWQNFMQKETDSNSSSQESSKTSSKITTPTSSEVALTEIATDDSVGTNLTVKYPKTWIMKHAEHSDAGVGVYSKQYEITSPDSDLSVKYIVTNVGGGGTCDPVNGDEIVQLDKSDIPGFTKAKFVSYSSNDGTFFAGIMNNNKETTSAKIGDSSCSATTFASLSGLVGDILSSKLSQKETSVSLTLTIEFKNIEHDGSANSSEAFRQTLTTENYKTAKRIIESLYIKE